MSTKFILCELSAHSSSLSSKCSKLFRKARFFKTELSLTLRTLRSFSLLSVTTGLVEIGHNNFETLAAGARKACNQKNIWSWLPLLSMWACSCSNAKSENSDWVFVSRTRRSKSLASLSPLVRRAWFATNLGPSVRRAVAGAGRRGPAHCGSVAAEWCRACVPSLRS